MRSFVYVTVSSKTTNIIHYVSSTTKIKYYKTTPCSGELRMQKLKSHLVRTQSLNVLPLKPGVGQYI